MSDEADKLNIKELPIPTAQRLDVFVCPGLSDEALSRWLSQGGDTTFHTSGDFAHKDEAEAARLCGIALFTVWSQRGVRDGFLDGKTSELLQPFYDRAGEEANVFQWQPIEKNFVRRGLDWFNERKT